MATTTPLEELGYPLFYPIETAEVPGLDAPSPRLDEAHRTRVRALDGMQKEALVTSAATGRTWRLVSDEGPYLDGHDVAPSPLAFMTAGMVSSHLTELLALAEGRGIDLRDVTLVQDNYYTMRGSALRGDMTGGALPVALDAVVGADADGAAIRDLLEEATRTSPIAGLVRDAHESRFKLALGGEAIPTDRVQELDGPLLPEPDGVFDAIPRNAEEHDPPHVRHTGRTTEPLPEADERYTGGEGSSLVEEQDRILHLRGTATVADDGVKRIEVELFSPRGSVFEFRSDEPEGRGGEGRAPDATTYMAAGIGFCFMTQFGRYADIVERELTDYRIVQDTHLSGGRRESPAEADPVETHVFLDTPEGEEFAREALDMSEQTCFLHALCRTELDPEVEVTAV